MRRTLGKIAADLNRVSVEQVSIVVPEIERAVRRYGNRFKRHPGFELLSAQFDILVVEPAFVLE
jgi:hypothetical protein